MRSVSERISDRRLRKAAAEYDPALAFPMPDIEDFVWQAINHLGEDPGASITAWCYASVPVPGPTGWNMLSSIQVDVRDVSKAAAFRRSDTARRIVLGLVSLPWSEGVINRSDLSAGPTWLADYGTGKPRYTQQFVMQVHPNNQKGVK